jgi:hypothetical protein
MQEMKQMPCMKGLRDYRACATDMNLMLQRLCCKDMCYEIHGAVPEQRGDLQRALQTVRTLRQFPEPLYAPGVGRCMLDEELHHRAQPPFNRPATQWNPIHHRKVRIAAEQGAKESRDWHGRPVTMVGPQCDVH